MALCDTDDIKRWLKDDSVDDDDLTEWLEVAEERVRDHTGYDFNSGAQEDNFYNVRQGAILHLRNLDPSSLTVTLYAAAGSDGVEVDENSSWQLLNRGKLQLFFARYEIDPGLGGQGGTVQRRPGYYARVKVEYTGSGTVPASVREACACIAAHMYRTCVLEASGLTSERLGDYSYSRSPEKDSVSMPAAAQRLLSAYRKSGIRST